ncbi:ATP-binding protein [Sphingomonas sp. NIBR02145]|uniref:AlbA family DNA-binding domain-containing protein n=1 Tax=Sphingomonas sp. NIBR02145 TaxID=3014784 RepID=UPI0022B4EC22|nr:ATP-binding protein [Sphingomonas sp. NIBR02145]WHU02742.1 ATP-binding protein [Sphingomonas sp. NIBR02145]
MRPLDEWDENDLQALIANQVQESLQLDYKQSAALAKNNNSQNELAKDVSAFANSAGGRIIYGIAEANNLPANIDGGCDPTVITREWIENSILGHVQPRIAGLVIKPIPLASGGVAYVIDIPQATTFAPHQANHRYHKRVNFQSLPMEDYEVKDLMRRASSSEPFIYFTLHNFQNEAGANRSKLTAHIGNRSSEPMLYAHIKVFVGTPMFSGEQPGYGMWQFFEGALQAGNLAENAPVHVYTQNHSIPGSMPIFKETQFTLLDLDMPRPDVGHYHLGYEIACPGYSHFIVREFFFNGAGLVPMDKEANLLIDPFAAVPA